MFCNAGKYPLCSVIFSFHWQDHVSACVVQEIAAYETYENALGLAQLVSAQF